MSGLARSRRITPYSPPRSVVALPPRDDARSVPAENTVAVPVRTPTQRSGSSSSRSSAAPMPSASVLVDRVALRLALHRDDAATRLRRTSVSTRHAAGVYGRRADQGSSTTLIAPAARSAATRNASAASSSANRWLTNTSASSG